MGKTQLSMLPVIADPNPIRDQVTCLYGYQLAQKAITQFPSRESCRSWGKSNILKLKRTISLMGCTMIGILMFPYWALTLAAIWAALTLFVTVGIKGAGFTLQILSKTPKISTQLSPQTTQFRLPSVSVMVPLLHEQEIAGALIKRL